MKKTISAIAALGFCTLLGGAPAGAQQLDKVHLQLDWIPTGEHAAYFAGWSRGIFREQGIDISMSRGYGSGDTVTKVAAGASPFGVADISAVFTARARQNTPVKAVMALYTHSPHSMFVLRSSGITSLAQLAGKRIGITPGNSHRLYFPEVARRVGIDPNSIQWVNTDASAMAALLIGRRLDAAPFFAIHHYYQNKAARRAGQEIVSLPFVSAGFAIYATAIVTTDAIIQEKPDLVRRFLRAIQNSFTWSRDNADEACKLHVQRNPEVEHDDCMGSFRAVVSYVFTDHARETGLGKFQAQRLEFTWQQVAKSQQLNPSWNYQQAVDQRFVP